jgi:3-oxoacyl-[acyl-carrier-protein] synthase III
MAFLDIKNIVVKGIAACVPEQVEDNRTLSLLGTATDIAKFIETTSIVKRHIVGNSGICASDLCVVAAERLIKDLGWNREEIDCLIFVTQTPDYQLPATSCILQHRLNLSTDCFALQISLGCSGWVYGLTTIASLMTNGQFRKGLLLVGDTASLTKSLSDKSTYPLFGDAGTATAIAFEEGAKGIQAHVGTNGEGYDKIIIEDGGYRNPFSADSLKMKEKEPGVSSNKLQTKMNGVDVFIFGITHAPRSMQALAQKFLINLQEVDYFVLHQANKMMTEKIRKKINAAPEKVPYSLDNYGNTSSASIPLTIVTQLKDQLANGKHRLIACGFGVGLSWGSVYFETENFYCSPVLYL